MALWAGESVPGAFRGLVKAAGLWERDDLVAGVPRDGTFEVTGPPSRVLSVADLPAAAGRLVLSAELPCS